MSTCSNNPHQPSDKPCRCAMASSCHREAFPVDLSAERAVARRQFTITAAVAGVALVIGRYATKLSRLFSPERAALPMVAIASLDDLPIGAAKAFTYPGDHDTCLLLRLPDGELVAFADRCTHLACAVRPDFETGRLNCPCHAGFFDMATGQPLAGPPKEPLTRVSLTLRGSTVYASGQAKNRG